MLSEGRKGERGLPDRLGEASIASGDYYWLEKT